MHAQSMPVAVIYIVIDCAQPSILLFALFNSTHWYERPIKKRKILCKYPISGVSQEGPLRILVKILKSRAGQFLRLLHKFFLGAFSGKISLIKKLRISK